MLNLDQPIFSYAGALKSAAKPVRWHMYALAACAGLLLAALAV